MANKFSLFDQIPWEQAYTTFISLEREKKIAAFVGIFIVLAILIVLPVSCASKRLGRLETDYLNSQKNLAELAEKAQTYQTLKRTVDSLEAGLGKGKEASLSTVLENLAKPLSFTNIDFKAQAESVIAPENFDIQARKVEIKEAPLASVVDYLDRIQKSRQMVMRVDKLDIKANRKNRALVDALFVVVTFIPKPDPDGRDQSPPQKEAVDGSKEAAKTSAKEKKK